MNSKKSRFSALTFLTLLAMFFNCNVLGYNFETESRDVSFKPSEMPSLSFVIKEDEPKLILESFKCEIKFDSDKLKYKKINCKGNIKRTDIKVEKNEGTLNLLYCPKKPREVLFAGKKSEIFEVMFTVKNKVYTGTTSIHTDFKSLDSGSFICSSDSEISIIGNPGMENCKLESLTAEQGNLSPVFDSNVFEYSIEVPAETKNLDFDAVPLSEDLSVKISRRKLSAAGKLTSIKITVSNKSLRVKSVYNIEVDRKPKDALKNPKKSEADEKLEADTDTKTKVKAKSKERKHSSKYDCTEVENQDCNNELETENSELENNSEAVVLKNDSFKIYLMIAFGTLLCAVSVYYIIKFIKFIKFRKNLFKKPNNSINNNF